MRWLSALACLKTMESLLQISTVGAFLLGVSKRNASTTGVHADDFAVSALVFRTIELVIGMKLNDRKMPLGVVRNDKRYALPSWNCWPLGNP